VRHGRSGVEWSGGGAGAVAASRRGEARGRACCCCGWRAVCNRWLLHPQHSFFSLAPGKPGEWHFRGKASPAAGTVICEQ